MLRSWRLGSLFGIGIYIHSTFLLLPLLLILTSEAMGVGTILFLLAFLAAVFGCVVLHELGHALMARRFGIRTLDITLYPIGGVARLAQMTERPSEELWIALAGPAVNVAIAALLTPLVVAGVLFNPLVLEAASPLGGEVWSVAVSFLLHLLLANVVLVLFNLLPAFPMDGGRVLRALLAMRMGVVRATTIAVGVGRGLILAALVLSLVFAPSYLLSNPMLVLLAVFVLLVGQHELFAIRQREAARQAAATAPVVSLLPISALGANVAPDFSGVTRDERHGVGIRWYNGRPIGVFLLPSE
jgi:Zn-dependent protease